MQLTPPISSENLMQSRLDELCLQSIDVGGADDCFQRLGAAYMQMSHRDRQHEYHKAALTFRLTLPSPPLLSWQGIIKSKARKHGLHC